MEFLSEIISAVTLGIIGLVFWQVKKNNGHEQKLRDETRKDVKAMMKDQNSISIKFERLEKDWEKYNVEKAYPSAKRAHFRLDELESET